jgi:phenylalanyl-tRNA synthetase alpha subunit
MELLLPLLLYLGYSFFISYAKKKQGEYQEPELEPYPENKKTKSNTKKPNIKKNIEAKEGSMQREKREEKKKTGMQYEAKVEDINQELKDKREKAKKKKAEAKKKLRKVKQKKDNIKRGYNQGIDINNLGRRQLQQGIILTEVLKPPRAKRPYRFNSKRE